MENKEKKHDKSSKVLPKVKNLKIKEKVSKNKKQKINYLNIIYSFR